MKYFDIQNLIIPTKDVILGKEKERNFKREITFLVTRGLQEL